MSYDKHRYGKLIEDTSNAYLKVNDEYLKSMTDEYHLVSRWSNDPRKIMNVIGTSNDGLTVAYTAAPRLCHDHVTLTCFDFQKIGHLNKGVQIANAQAPQQPQQPQ